MHFYEANSHELSDNIVTKWERDMSNEEEEKQKMKEKKSPNTEGKPTLYIGTIL